MTNDDRLGRRRLGAKADTAKAALEPIATTWLLNMSATNALVICRNVLEESIANTPE